MVKSGPLRSISAHSPEQIRAATFADLATLEDYGEAIGRNKRAVQRMVRQGLPVRHIGRTPYVVLSQAAAFWATRAKREPVHAA